MEATTLAQELGWIMSMVGIGAMLSVVMQLWAGAPQILREVVEVGS